MIIMILKCLNHCNNSNLKSIDFLCLLKLIDHLNYFTNSHMTYLCDSIMKGFYNSYNPRSVDHIC